MYLIQVVSLLGVVLLQFGNTMIISGPCLSFILAAFVIMAVQASIYIRKTLTLHYI